jgi:hypothetical protein
LRVDAEEESPRRLSDLIQHLPPDAALWRVIKNKPEKSEHTTKKEEVKAFVDEHLAGAFSG